VIVNAMDEALLLGVLLSGNGRDPSFSSGTLYNTVVRQRTLHRMMDAGLVHNYWGRGQVMYALTVVGESRQAVVAREALQKRLQRAGTLSAMRIKRAHND